MEIHLKVLSKLDAGGGAIYLYSYFFCICFAKALLFCKYVFFVLQMVFLFLQISFFLLSL